MEVLWFHLWLAAFFVKDGMEEKFVEEFNKEFKNDFLLLTKSEVLEQKIFGEGIENLKFKDFA
jgi:hypothetical protein